MNETLTHLERLEVEAIHIMREVVAEAEKPVMMYSVGKDSAVMLHLARKAFYAPAAGGTSSRNREFPSARRCGYDRPVYDQGDAQEWIDASASPPRIVS